MKLPAFLTSRSRGRTPKYPFEQRVRLYAIRGGLLLLVSAAGVGLFALGLRADAFVRKSDFFRIQDLVITGATPQLEREVRILVDALKQEGENNLFLLSTDEVERRVEELPRVRSASAAKELPHTLRVKLDERVPLIAGLAGGLFWLDEEGVLIDRATPREVAEAGLPILTGLRGSRFHPGMKLEQPRLDETLRAILFLKEKDPELGRQFAEWHLNSRDEVVGILKPGVEVRFGSADPLVRLPALSAVLREKPEIRDSTYLDLRFESQVVSY